MYGGTEEDVAYAYSGTTGHELTPQGNHGNPSPCFSRADTRRYLHGSSVHEHCDGRPAMGMLISVLERASPEPVFTVDHCRPLRCLHEAASSGTYLLTIKGGAPRKVGSRTAIERGRCRQSGPLGHGLHTQGGGCKSQTGFKGKPQAHPLRLRLAPNNSAILGGETRRFRFRRDEHPCRGKNANTCRAACGTHDSSAFPRKCGKSRA